MTLGNYRVRRATLDDLDALTKLWQSMHLPVDELAKKITDFQVVENADAELVGPLGSKCWSARAGCIAKPSLTSRWRNMSVLNCGASAVGRDQQRACTGCGRRNRRRFGVGSGLAKPDPEALEKLPQPWRALKGQWLTLKLKEDIEEVLSADKEFAMFMQSERQRTERAFQQAKILKFVAMLLAIGILFLVIGGAFLIMRRNPQLLHR